MKLAAIDIGTNSIHMVIVEATGKYSFEVIDREKEMVKLGVGVFATNQLSEQAFRDGLETIRRYVQLADRHGVDEIITAATSATREARNGSEFLDEVVRQTGISPRVISGNEEARLIFLAVRSAIAIKDENVLVIDIGGGSTEAVIGNQSQIRFGRSMKLGVLRLLDMFEDQGAVGAKARGVLEAHIRFAARDVMKEVREVGFSRVIGTSGTIRTLGEAAHLAAGGAALKSLNAEVVQLSDIKKFTQRLLKMSPEERAALPALNKRRADAIHLGGVLLVQLLEAAGVGEITLCDASLREGLIIDYLERYSGRIAEVTPQRDLRYRSVAQLALKFNSDLSQKKHVAGLALQIFDQTVSLHGYGRFEREILEYAALLHDVGQYIRFNDYHDHSRYIIQHAGLRSFTDVEVLLIADVAYYQREAKLVKKPGELSHYPKLHRRMIRILAGMLRLAVGLDRTKNQRVESLSCRITAKKLTISVRGEDDLELEIWAANRDRKVLARALGVKMKVVHDE